MAVCRTPRSTALPLVAVAVTLLLWSSAFVAIRHLGDDVLAGRAVAGPAAGRLGRARGRAARPAAGCRPTRREWPGWWSIGVLWFGLYNVALNAGERRVDAGTAAMLIQLSPVLVAVLAAIFLKEQATAASASACSSRSRESC